MSSSTRRGRLQWACRWASETWKRQIIRNLRCRACRCLCTSHEEGGKFHTKEVWETICNEAKYFKGIYSTLDRLRSKHTLGFRILQDGQRSYPQWSRCQNGTLTLERAFSCNIAKKVKNFGYMTWEEPTLKADPVATAKSLIEQYGRV